jgi:hypothetical protein
MRGAGVVSNVVLARFGQERDHEDERRHTNSVTSYSDGSSSLTMRTSLSTTS